jgi:trehalose synthase
LTALTEVNIGALSPERFREVLGERFEPIALGIERGRKLFAGRAVWHVNSTARGGGVAELLQSLLAYARGSGVDTRWMVIGGNPDFFAVTKRIHNHLHGTGGDGGPLGDAEREVYERTLAPAATELAQLVRPNDVVFLHDPQTAGMVDALRETGAVVVWRCHVGLDLPNPIAHGAWDFLRPYVEKAHAYVFSRRAFVWDHLDRERIWLVAPSIDAFSPKNQELSDEQVRAIMRRSGLADGAAPDLATFVRADGTPGRVDRPAELLQEALVPADATLITQVSRWDRLKDPIGVLEGFAATFADREDVHLLLAGPSVAAVADDPEGGEVLAEATSAWRGLGGPIRARVHLACLPMDDLQENAAMVNAIQRRSDIVVQKSLAEGFGLTIAEAMWKERPVVASGRGGIQDQITTGESGILLDDPEDLDAFGRALQGLVDDPEERDRLGRAARLRVEEEFLGTRHLLQYLNLLAGLLETRSGPKSGP